MSRGKTRAVFLAHEARGYLTAGEADRAAAAATEALCLGRHTGAEGVDDLLHHARAVRAT